METADKHPQVFIYQTGGVDSVILGGDTNYGTLHAKFICGETGGFVGTSNFDYRSNLYNNELVSYLKEAGAARKQRGIFKTVRCLGLEYLMQ